MKAGKCDCGGALRSAKLRKFSLAEYLGIDVTADQVHGWRCGRCGWETISGKTVERAMHAAAAAILGVEERIHPELARFLRKYLGLTQGDLAARMGITRKTVNQWETGGAISPQHDLILRALVYAAMSDTVRPDATALDHVHTAAPKPRSRRLRVEHLDRAA